MKNLINHSPLRSHIHKNLAKVALKEEEADLCLTGGKVVNPFSWSIERQDVAIKGDRIAGVGLGFKAKRFFDCKGLYICPGLIDAHIHIESTMLSPRQFARTVVPHGTTCVVADPHEIANCLGIAGIEFMISQSDNIPMDIFYTAPSCVPATHLETSGAELGAKEIEKLLRLHKIIALGEVMNFPGVIYGDKEVGLKLEIARRMGIPIDGHAPGLSGDALCAYISAGIDSDHECTTLSEAEEKLSRGMYLFLREGTSEQNLEELAGAVTPHNVHKCCLVSDDRSPDDLLEKGHMDYSLKMAVRAGIDPIGAIAMATINPACRFKLSERGAVVPGFLADLILLKDLKDFQVEATIFRGEVVAQKGKMVADIPESPLPKFVSSSIKVKQDSLDFSIKAISDRLRVIGIRPGQIVTDELVLPVTEESGMAVSDPKRDIIKLAVVERHHASGNVGLGFVKGLGIKNGALASTISHDSHNIVVAGTNDTDMLAAVKALMEIGGGIVVIKDGQVQASLSLSISGLMSDKKVEDVRAEFSGVKMAARTIGTALDNPFMILSFLALPVIPRLKLTDKGLVDVEKFSIVPLFFH